MQVEAVLSQIKPTDLKEYVTGNGWVPSELVEDDLFILNSPDRTRQLIVPRSMDTPDYFDAVEIFVRKISEIEDVPIGVIIQRLDSLRDDTLRLKFNNEEKTLNSISLKYIHTVIKNTEQMIMSGACSVVEPKLYHPRLSRVEAQQMIDASQFRHTERGSFIVSVSCPLNAVSTTAPLLSGRTETTFTREAINLIFLSISELVSAVENERINLLIDSQCSSSNPTISSNMCYALADVCSQAPSKNIEFEVDWSRTLNNIEYKKDRDICYVPTDIANSVYEIGKMLYQVQPDPNQSYLGTVENLNGRTAEDGRRQGDVVIALLMHDGRKQRAKVKLNADQYEAAARAHLSSDIFVSVRGILNPGKQPRVMTEVSEFSLVNP